MRTIVILVLTISLSISNLLASEAIAYQNNIDIEMYLLRKGSKVLITVMTNGSELPSLLTIERKSTAPLSKYRKVLTVDGDKLAILKEKGEVFLSDDYPESRQLDSYYRMTYYTKDDVLRTLPAIFLSRSSSENAVTYGDHQQDMSIFENEEELVVPTYEEYNIKFDAKRQGTKVLVTLGVNNSNLEGEFSIERKSAKPLASFRKVKTIYGEDKDAVLGAERVFLDKYPESRQLDSYYRFVVTDKEGNKLEFPAIFLEGDNATN